MRTSPFRHNILLSIVLSVVVCFAATSASAQDAESNANVFYQQAIELFNEGRYQEALASLDQAIALSPEPVFYCNRGAILLKLKDLPEALAALEVCRDQYSGDDEEERAQIASEVAALALSVRLIEPSARRIAITIATLPSNRLGETDARSTTDYVAWGLVGLAAVSLTAAVVVDQGTLTLIDDHEALAEAGQERERFNTLGQDIEDRQLAVGAMVALGSASLIGSAALFWLGAESQANNVSVKPSSDGSVLLMWQEGF